jgi:hypothetical protein
MWVTNAAQQIGLSGRETGGTIRRVSNGGVKTPPFLIRGEKSRLPDQLEPELNLP